MPTASWGYSGESAERTAARSTAPQELESGAEALAASSASIANHQQSLSLTLDGFTSTVRGLSAFQERSARGIGLLLGSRWGVEDAVWALGSGAAAVWATAPEPTAGARVWLIATLCAGAAAERAVVERIVSGPHGGRNWIGGARLCGGPPPPMLPSRALYAPSRFSSASNSCPV